eukprot:Phypoly_transcript_06277.p1 GENE.Phypoly_transcript_06277~~Phypoly_transcript_06277.p1  ORF type:complete len:559 (+),score=93.70 Phypoly_transcript_06277:93-1769(+)
MPNTTGSHSAENELGEYWDIKDLDIVCIPSASMDSTTLEKIIGINHYEERQLYNLLLLQNPKIRLIFVSSTPLDPTIVQYFTSLLPDTVSRSELEKRVIFLPVNDDSKRPLAEKILERPHLIDRIKQTVRPNKGLILCFTVTNLECQLVKELGMPIFGNDDPKYEHWGSKSGSREIFAGSDIPHARGTKLCRTSKELVRQIVALYKDKPFNKMVVKLDQGFSGQGNALLDLSSSAGKSDQNLEESILQALTKMELASPNGTWEWFEKRINEMGAIAEEFFEGEDPKCPSVQGCISLSGKVEILSTHEQVMKGQIYQGCLFPASDIYRAKLHRYGKLVGEYLASKGVRGHFGVDFLVQGSESELFALEINLRQCGTTHPYFSMKFLTDGKYDLNSGLFKSNTGKTKSYKHSDNLHKEKYKGILPADLLEACEKRKIIFDHASQCGPVFHLLGAISEFGKVGVTCIGNSEKEAAAIFSQVESVLDELGDRIQECKKQHELAGSQEVKKGEKQMKKDEKEIKTGEDEEHGVRKGGIGEAQEQRKSKQAKIDQADPVCGASE